MPKYVHHSSPDHENKPNSHLSKVAVYKLFEETDTEEGDDWQSDAESLDDSFDRMQFESSRSEDKLRMIVMM